MRKCDQYDACVLFRETLKDKPSTAELFINRYCKQDHKSCARHMVYAELGDITLPPDLFPNQREKAEQLIKKGKA